MLVLMYDVSAMRQDPNLFLLEADLKDPVVPVCHHLYTSDWLFSKLRHLVILSGSIKPWPMTVVKESVAMGELLIIHIDSEENLSDLMTKVTHSGKPCRLVGNIFYDIYGDHPKQRGKTS
jgi:hypothetical protein